MARLVYAYDGRSPAAGRREVWIDPATGEWFLLTGDKAQGDGILQTKRALAIAEGDAPPVNQPPAGGVIEGTFNGS